MKRLIIILIEVLTNVYGFGQSAYMHEAQEDGLYSEPIDAIGVLYVITFGGIIWLISAFIKYYSNQRRGNKLNRIAKDSSKSKYPRTGNSIADSVWKELIDRKEKENKPKYISLDKTNIIVFDGYLVDIEYHVQNMPKVTKSLSIYLIEELKILLNDEPIYFTSNHIVMADSHLILKTPGNPFNVYQDDLVVTKIFIETKRHCIKTGTIGPVKIGGKKEFRFVGFKLQYTEFCSLKTSQFIYPNAILADGNLDINFL